MTAMKKGTEQKHELSSADSIIEQYATMLGKKAEDVLPSLLASMKSDMHPNEKNIFYVLGAKEGLMMARAAHEQGSVIDPEVVGRIGLAYAVLTKIQAELAQ